jgi:hypothetical protein
MTAYVENNTYINLNVARNENAYSSYGALATNRPDVTSEAQYAVERINDSRLGLANPPFKLTNGSRNRLVDVQTNGILRGYVRRADLDAADDSSKYRLYFMYNPETIERSYMSYLDQQSLDPYNSMFGSNNMAAAPALLDFQFDLLFDRQLEVAQDPSHVGTKVDFDFFDLVVRGVVPDTNNSGNAIPDNGIMMINPRNVAVVFSPELVVHGRPYNAAVRIEKFNNRMTPTRMRVSISMKAFYIGPLLNLPNISRFSSEATYKATIPYDESVKYTAVATEVNFLNLGDTITSAWKSLFGGSDNPPASSGIPGHLGKAIPAGTLTGEQMADLVLSVGLRGEAAAIAIAIAAGESGWNSTKVYIAASDHSVGLWQINQLYHGGRTPPFGTDDELKDPSRNAACMMSLSNSGQKWTDWSVYNDGKYKKWLDQARNLVGQLGGN